MKTINDLVDHLNASFEYADFTIDTDYYLHEYYLYMKTFDDYGPLIEFDKQSKDWSIRKTLGLASKEVQKEVMDFIYTTDSNHWFDELEKKYYIAVGMYDRTSKIIYFKNDNALDFKLRTMIDFNEGDLQEYDIFTEGEIEELKSTLPEKMAKIVDVGKVAVKDD